VCRDRLGFRSGLALKRSLLEGGGVGRMRDRLVGVVLR